MLINYLVIYFFCPLTWRFFLCCCSVTKSCPALCDPMDCSTPSLLTPHHLLELAQVHVHCISDATQSSHLLSSFCPSIRNFSNESAVHIQFSSVTQSCLTVCDPMNHSTPGLPVHHQLPELTQTHVYQVSDAIQPSHPLSSPSSPALNPSQHQGLFQ